MVLRIYIEQHTLAKSMACSRTSAIYASSTSLEETVGFERMLQEALVYFEIRSV